MSLAVLYVDMNSFFASVEQQAKPHLRGRPVAVVPVDSDSTCCIAASAEAKAFGVRTGTNVGQARRLCPGLVCVHGDFPLYVRAHHAVVAAIEACIPVHGVHSVDEVSARLMGDERRPERAAEIARRIKASIRERIGRWTTCSIGIAPNRFLAKVAADLRKPDGLTIIEAQDMPGAIHHLQLTDLPGIAGRMERRLNLAGIHTVEQLCAMDEASLGRAWGSVVGRAWYLLLRGRDVKEKQSPRRSIGHSQVLAPEDRTPERARAVAMRLTNKTAARARSLGCLAGRLTVGIRHRPSISPRLARDDQGWEDRASLGGVNDTPTIAEAFARVWSRGPVAQGRDAVPVKVWVTLTDLSASASSPGPLFGGVDRRKDLSEAIDAIARRYGSDAVYQASMQSAKRPGPARIAFGFIPELEEGIGEQ